MNLFLLILNIVALPIMYIVLRRFLYKQVSTAALLKKMKEEVDKIVVDFNRITDRNVSIFEERVRTLQALITEAERRARLMGPSEISAQQSEVRYRELGDKVNEIKNIANNKARAKKDQRTQIRELARQGHPHSEISLRVGVSIAEIEALLAFPDEKEPQ